MKLVFLHGSPAVGKLTVAKALLSMVSGRLFDNHAAIDLARTVFDFGAPGFWDLVHRVRTSAIDAADAHGVSLVVTIAFLLPSSKAFGDPPTWFYQTFAGCGEEPPTCEQATHVRGRGVQLGRSLDDRERVRACNRATILARRRNNLSRNLVCCDGSRTEARAF